jgi:hypothetical protein
VPRESGTGSEHRPVAHRIPHSIRGVPNHLGLQATDRILPFVDGIRVRRAQLSSEGGATPLMQLLKEMREQGVVSKSYVPRIYCKAF